MPTLQRLFVIDDASAVRNAIELLFKAEGYPAEAYPSAGTFLSAIHPAQKGCAVTDVRMPGMDGLQLITRMKQEHISLPVIVLTGYADVRLAVEAMKLGAVDLIQKPFQQKASSPRYAPHWIVAPPKIYARRTRRFGSAGLRPSHAGKRKLWASC